MANEDTQFGPTDLGFVERFYSDVVKAKRDRAIELFGRSVDLTDNSVFGQFINSMSYEEALIWQIIENVYYSRYVHFATGKSLDDVVFAKGLFRKAGAYAEGEITVTKDATYKKRIYIPKGSIVTDMDGLFPFITIKEIEFPANTDISSITVPIEALNLGENYNVPPKKISKLAQTVSGISRIENQNATYNGSNAETDPELRLRAINYKPSEVGTRQAIINKILSIDGVKNVQLKEYFKNTVMPKTYIGLDGESFNSVYGCSFIACINGVTDNNRQQILDAVDDVRAYGIKAYCIEATPLLMNIKITSSYSGSIEDLTKAIRDNINAYLTSPTFNGIVTYFDLVRELTSIQQLGKPTSVVFTVPEYKLTLSTIGDELDMTTDVNQDKYLSINTIEVTTIGV